MTLSITSIITPIAGILLLFIAISLLVWVYLKLMNSIKRLNVTIEKADFINNHDLITLLKNRTHFFERLNQTLLSDKNKKQTMALLLIDIDNFRTINDLLGYTGGDLFLHEAAERLSLINHKHKGSLGHLASDQFVFSLPAFSDLKHISNLAGAIIESFKTPFYVKGKEINATVSIGISLYPTDSLDAKELLIHASLARDHSKLIGKNNFFFYSTELEKQVSVEHQLENELRRAIEKNQLQVFYQPKVNTNTRLIESAEALIRWKHPEMGMISPVQFIPLAEKSGLIVPIGNWILLQICQDLKTLEKLGFGEISFAMNLTAVQFKTGDIAGYIAQTLWETELNPHRLELEITESLVMENVEKSLLMLSVLKTMGIKLSIDDFGTGYSSLSQLKRFPVDALKIDQAFVRDMDTNIEDAAIVTTIINMAKCMNLKTIAEGVENERQFELLKQEKCDLIQGYLFSQPIPFEEFVKLLNKGKL